MHECERSTDRGSSLKKVSLLACGREDGEKGNERVELEKIKETKKGELMRDARHAGAGGQNWRDQTSAVFVVLSS